MDKNIPCAIVGATFGFLLGIIFICNIQNPLQVTSADKFVTWGPTEGCQIHHPIKLEEEKIAHIWCEAKHYQYDIWRGSTITETLTYNKE